MKSKNMTVVKCGGSTIQELGNHFTTLMRKLHDRSGTILVHGGGPAISTLENRLQLKSHFNASGLRITDESTLEVIIQALCGQINSHLVAMLVQNDIPALGLSGIDAGLFQTRLKDFKNLGWVGEITAVKKEILTKLCLQDFLPVVAPPSLYRPNENTESGSLPIQFLNINADEAVGAIATAIDAKDVIFISDIPGIIGEQGHVLSTVTVAEIDHLIETKVIYGGMIPKVKGAMQILKNGATEKVFIIDGKSDLSLENGTTITP